jgi:hypothetical protein
MMQDSSIGNKSDPKDEVTVTKCHGSVDDMEAKVHAFMSSVLTLSTLQSVKELPVSIG